MAVAPKITVPLVADKQTLIEALHKQSSGCYHNGDVKQCELTASTVFKTGVIRQPEEFLQDLKDMPAVQAVIKDALKEAWREGNNALSYDNPYE